MQHPAVFFHDGVANGQAEAAPGWLGRKVGIEDFCRQVFRDSLAAIGNPDLDITSWGNNYARLSFELHVASRNTNGAAMGHCLARVDHQRVDHLFDLSGVNFGFPEIDGNIDVSAEI